MKRFAMLSFLGACAFAGGSAAVSLSPQLISPAIAQQQQPPAKESGSSNHADLGQLGDRFEAIARKVCPAVVSIETVKPSRPNPTGKKGRPLEESGSGFIVRGGGKSGYLVLTNNHVIADARSEQITIHLADGRVFHPTQLWADPETDVAVLGLGTAEALPALTLGNSNSARVGQWVLAIGSPFGLNQTVTHGIISARERGQVSLGNAIRIKEFLQTDAAINPGSSGGPLVDLRGEVVGINTAIASPSGSNSGVAFSIPVNLVTRVMQQLLEKGSVARGYLGMQVAHAYEPADAMRLGLDRLQGAWIESVYPETPAALAGLKSGDVVLQVEGVAIRNENHLINLISALPPGQRVRLHVWRNRNRVTLDAVVGDWAKARERFR
jgi:S1-C subfamily serine protease